MEIKDLGTEKFIPDNSDIIPIQEAGGVTRRIKRGNFLAGITSSNQFIQLLDKKTSGTNGGQAVVSQWATRVINTINVDDTGLVQLLNNTFKLPGGSYEIDASLTFYAMSDTKLRLYNVTDNSVILYGLNSYFQASQSGGALQTRITGRFTIAANKYLAIQYWSKSASNLNVYNFGGSVSDGSPEIYASIDLRKVA